MLCLRASRSFWPATRDMSLTRPCTQAQVQTELQNAVLRGQQELLHDGALPAKVRELHERQTALAAQLQVRCCLSLVW